MEINKKYKINNLKGVLSNGKWIYLRKDKKIKGKNYNIDIEICRADLNFSEDKDTGERYFLRIESYDNRYPGDKDGGTIIDERLIFKKLEAVIDYLDKKAFLKKGDWIINE